MKPRPSRYNVAIHVLKKFVVFLKSGQPFLHHLGRSKEEERLRCVRSFAKAGWKVWRSGNGLWGSGTGLWLANRYRPRKGHCRPTQDVLQAYRGGGRSFFTFNRDAARKNNVLGAWEASLKRGRSCDIRERPPRNGHHCPPH